MQKISTLFVLSFLALATLSVREAKAATPVPSCEFIDEVNRVTEEAFGQIAHLVLDGWTYHMAVGPGSEKVIKEARDSLALVCPKAKWRIMNSAPRIRYIQP